MKRLAGIMMVGIMSLTPCAAHAIEGYVEFAKISGDNYYCNANNDTEVEYETTVHVDVEVTRRITFETEMITYIKGTTAKQDGFCPSGIRFKSGLSYRAGHHELRVEHSCHHAIDALAPVVEVDRIAYRYNF